jgi:hypothetical protein
MMKRLRNLPGAATAVGAFLLTVLLGLGGASASALWQQSAIVTVTVTAAAAWPEFSCATADSANKGVNLSYSLPLVPQHLMLVGKRADGTDGATSVQLVSGSSGTYHLMGDSQFVSENQVGASLTIKLIASYVNQAPLSQELKLTLNTGTGNRKIFCG